MDAGVAKQKDKTPGPFQICRCVYVSLKADEKPNADTIYTRKQTNVKVFVHAKLNIFE